jgi:hypothetical protein
LIEARSLPLGDTDEGRAWCLKALHPSDPLVEVRGIPDKSAVPSVFVNYQSTFALDAPAGAVGSWGFNLDFLAHPVGFAHVNTFDPDSLHTAETMFNNSQLPGLTHAEKYRSFRQLAQRWRVAYAGISVYQDSAALSNQGTIVACQAAAEPRTLSMIPMALNAIDPSLATIPIHNYAYEDRALFGTSQNMPNAYFGRSCDGCYMPMKLTKTCQQWKSQADEVMYVTVSELDQAQPKGVAKLFTDGDAKSWPFSDIDACYCDGSVDGIGTRTSPLCNEVTGRISAENLALTTRYTFFVRMGFEIQVSPGSLMSPHQQLSPRYDSAALKTYFSIAREMKDAYPEDYNSLGKLWDVISRAARTVLPVLKMIPGVGSVASLVEAGVGLGDRIKAAVSKPAAASEADRTIVRKMVASAKPSPAIESKKKPRPLRVERKPRP